MRANTAAIRRFPVLLSAKDYFCPSCRKARKPANLSLRLHNRPASTLSSVTAVHAKKEVPTAFRGVHDALGTLQRDAAVYTNLSQLQLALRGLESENGITRIAALGGPDARQTRRLVRVLLADPLTPEAEWEQRLSNLDNDDGRAVLLRYAERLDFDDRRPLVRTLFMPSLILQNHKIEILIQAASEISETDSAGGQQYLVPGLESPTSSTGRFQTVTYPVHKALLLVQNWQGTRALATPESHEAGGVGENTITAVADTPFASLSSPNPPLRPINVINLDRAEEAITSFRQSLDNSLSYEHAWFDSGLPKLSTWLIEGTERLPLILKPTIRRLIEVLVANVERAIDQEETEQLQQEAAAVVSTVTRDTMTTLLETWAEAAHTELRDSLDEALESIQWRKLAWWKLSWRVDDVTHITSDILQTSWLVEAERGIIYLGGRIEQAGLLPPSPPPSAAAKRKKLDSASLPLGTPPPEHLYLSHIAPSQRKRPSSIISPLPSSTPSISDTRTHLLTTVSGLQALSQRLVLESLSATFLTSSLSALIYISISTTSIYESGAVAAVAIVWSLSRLQKRWETARQAWMADVREAGGRCLRGVETEYRRFIAIEGMGRRYGDGQGRSEREGARDAVGGVRRALREMKK